MIVAVKSSEQHYAWGVALMSSLAVTGIVQKVVALATLAMAVVVTLEMAFGYGATTPIPSGVQWASMIAAYIMGAFWMFGPWPTLKQAFAFVMIADLAIFSATMVADFPPEITLGKTAFLIELGMFVGFFFERWMLATHVVFCILAATVIAVYVVKYEGVSVLMAIVVWSPVVVSIGGFALLLHFAARSMRLEFE
ncbi:giguanylate cyclase [Rhodococcus sp. BP-252]|uniref:Giguanylate cyclase n=1 Tax=Rhodococcoides kyotonense TaxID=398843 RepID=A0A177Y6Y7_9NOCA|nr:giguanylate cyclase [Rhodococcus sp. BP-320]MBY6416300.1 giguanylate cyclase [Rhodococcus sp. BP-321]MBY6420295.1 giguanylate cyclase [Rhodococcus sp. BP-324]MBY6424974.1 giguanylate cyclase [Rhodococcus sp. BP-323]MBY6430320.1 giguanylate cyclase [Rhodococcus sp. BP-322]MBY6439195.1 giguanylate cyclase [Rhodococcus sp. BP-319]MBY6444157.1 giguanylate cyclase [Rhodococcus sp. BP-318]MBY6448868.1 giguanylate cyclase [Rhodococcus sp. BP-315]MBY6453482.1 giguanylate cyclase [Rhodococcus sp.